jgi:aspartyl-tRNA(Asn)/glutamyl-tRNA(Gln) amidotransferase subunit B
MELVTEPVIHDAATAVAFAKELQLLLRYLGVGEANMEKGELRVEANVSVASEEDTKAGKLGVKTEVKNLNSFRAVERAIAYEIDRQTKILEKGAAEQEAEKVVQETRGWNENAGKTFSQRTKESSHDYRYFPDPDIPKMKLSELSDGFVGETLRKELPELPWTLRARLVRDFSMTEKEAAMFVESPQLFDYFKKVMTALLSIESSAADKKISRLVINYLSSDYVGLLKKEYNNDAEATETYLDHLADISAEHFAQLIILVAHGKINSRGAKDILAILLKNQTGDRADQQEDPEAIAEKNGFIQKIDENDLKNMIAEIVVANPTVVADYKKGKTAALQFLIGQGMKTSRGSANPEILRKLFIENIA